ncbi:hypothetical protein KSP39_PZI013198 [Platanthera zijinensis]|uniref:ATP-dependent helicase C-terminal domain-containing protein n=1 Tax=Platanthera zijinensis TaxID=2320716 RepID=A0AAP0G3C9_9ASPA
MLKKKFNDTYKSSKNLLSGSEWYCHQAFRALNQAAGRCIRHRFDYGAIILLDERYKEQRNLAYISKWLRSSIKSYKSFDESLEGLQTFFRNTKSQHILEEVSNDLADYNNNKDILQSFKSPHQVTSLKESKIIQYMKISTGLVKENSSVFQPKTPLIKTNEGEDKKALRRDINDDSERKSLRHFSAYPFSPSSSPDLPVVLDDNVKSAPSDTLVFQNFHQVSELPSTLSCVTTSDEFASHDAGLVVAFTPEKLTFSVPSDVNGDPYFAMSVNSYNQKKRRMKELQNTSCTEMNCSNICFSNSTAGFDFRSRTSIPKNIDRRTETSYEDNKKVCLELFTPENQYIPPPSSDPSEQLELHVCCLSCKNPLGLPENSFLVKSFMILSSKVYLSYIRSYGTPSSLRLDWLSKIPRKNIPILTSDISLINERIFKERTKKNLSHDGIWCEEDGCVFRTVFCPFCTTCETCFGVQVLATDASNANLLNKVLFYADCLCVNDESKSFNEGVLPKSGNLLREGSDQVGNGKYALNIPLDEAAYDQEQKPAATMIKTDNSHPRTVENDKFACKGAIGKPGYSPKKKVNSVKENAGFHQPRPIDIEKFAYKPQNKPSFHEKIPSNTQILPEQIEKSPHCPCPKTSNSPTTARSKLKLPRRR